MFFISAVTITIFSLRNLKVQEHKIIATRYGEEALEWVKQEKEDDWQAFSLHDDSAGTGTKYCLNLSSPDWTTKSDCGNSYTLGQPVGIFKRVLTITNSGNPVDSITGNLSVSWLENGVEQQVVLKFVFNLWE